MTTQKTTYLALYELMQRLRMTAATLYDKAQVAGQSPEQIAQSLQPITDALNKTMKRAVEYSLGDVIMAVKMFENEALKHEHDSQFCLSKKRDVNEHRMALLHMLKADMKAKNQTERQEGNFMVTLVGEDIAIR